MAGPVPKPTNVTFPLRTIVATSLHMIGQDEGYITQQREATTNTMTKVQAELKKNSAPELEPVKWILADEMIGYFRTLKEKPIYRDILKMEDATLYETMIDIAGRDEIAPLHFSFAVLMPQLYAKLNPKKPKALNALKSEAKVYEPNSFLGILNEEERFFVKLVRVGSVDSTRGGNLFEVRDRSDNVAFFYDKPDKLQSLVKLGDCFSIHAIPTRHVPEKGVNQTFFRTVKVLQDTIKEGRSTIDKTNDATGGTFTH